MAPSNKNINYTGEDRQDSGRPNQHQEDGLCQQHHKPKFTFRAGIQNTNRAEEPAGKGEESPLTRTNVIAGTSPSTNINDIVQADGISNNNDEDNHHINQRISQYIRGQDSTVSPPRPPKMKLNMRGNADTYTGARAKVTNEQHKNIPTVTTHTHHHGSVTEGFQEATGVVIFRPRTKSAPATPVIDENNNPTTTPSMYPTTRKRCRGTIYRLAQVGRSNHPGQQVGPCYTHQRPNSNSQHISSKVPEWALQQTKDENGNDNFHQNEEGKLITTSLGHPHCNYCKLPSHSRQKCAFRLPRSGLEK